MEPDGVVPLSKVNEGTGKRSNSYPHPVSCKRSVFSVSSGKVTVGYLEQVLELEECGFGARFPAFGAGDFGSLELSWRDYYSEPQRTVKLQNKRTK